MGINQDYVDRIREQWARERPELDTAGFAVVARVMVLGKLLERGMAHAVEPLGLTLGAFDVLATLRRQGSPWCLAPSELSQATLLTSGAMTNRLDRLEGAGLVRREADPDDRRGVRVYLTAEGRELVDRAVVARFAEAERLLQGMSGEDRARLEVQLRGLLLQLGGAVTEPR